MQFCPWSENICQPFSDKLLETLYRNYYLNRRYWILHLYALTNKRIPQVLFICGLRK